MIKTLHPTLKACNCGFIGVKSALYNHLAAKERLAIFMHQTDSFWKDHGEVPLNDDDPRLSNNFLNKPSC